MYYRYEFLRTGSNIPSYDNWGADIRWKTIGVFMGQTDALKYSKKWSTRGIPFDFVKWHEPPYDYFREDNCCYYTSLGSKKFRKTVIPHIQECLVSGISLILRTYRDLPGISFKDRHQVIADKLPLGAYEVIHVGHR